MYVSRKKKAVKLVMLITLPPFRPPSSYSGHLRQKPSLPVPPVFLTVMTTCLSTCCNLSRLSSLRLTCALTWPSSCSSEPSRTNTWDINSSGCSGETDSDAHSLVCLFSVKYHTWPLRDVRVKVLPLSVLVCLYLK